VQLPLYLWHCRLKTPSDKAAGVHDMPLSDKLPLSTAGAQPASMFHITMNKKRQLFRG